jgi:myo-inositol-1(or 4)-monophosphatase
MNERAAHAIELAEPNALRVLAEQAARVGGALAREAFGRRQTVRLKSDQSEVTDVDVAAEKAIIDFIRAARPRDRFLGEESAESDAADASPAGETPALPRRSEPAAPDSVAWIIDPIDGTRNFIRHMPLFACSIAAMHAGAPVAGAIFEPIQDTMYSAHRGGGLHLNGRPFQPAPDQRLSAGDPQRKLFVGIPSARRESTTPLVLHAIENHVVRNFGSIALHLALVALEHLDAAVVSNAKLWDIAAGCLLVQESSGLVTGPAGEPLFPIDLPRYRGEEIQLLAGTAEAYTRLRRELAAGA